MPHFFGKRVNSARGQKPNAPAHQNQNQNGQSNFRDLVSNRQLNRNIQNKSLNTQSKKGLSEVSIINQQPTKDNKDLEIYETSAARISFPKIGKEDEKEQKLN